MGLTRAELDALAIGGENKRGTSMDMIMKILMGGWLPEGKRTQMVAAATAMGALLVALVQWASGDMALSALFQLITEKWEIFVLAFGGYFMAEKVDAVKKEVK